MKKIWKYVFYAAVILLVLYVVFQSTRETFASANPIPSEAELDALQASLDRANADAYKNKIPFPQVGTNILQSAPQSVKAVHKFLKANVIPLLPYKMAKQAQTPEGDLTDFYILLFMSMSNKPLVAPIAYAVRQQSSAPTIPEFVDMAVKIVKENAIRPGDTWPDPQTKGLIDQMKKGETTIQTPEGDTIPNPGYWGHKYIYGDSKTPAKSGPASAGSAGSAGTPALGSSKCVPSVHSIPGGMTETRCFN